MGDTTLSDADLVAAYCAGDTRAFDELICRYWKRVYNKCLKILRNAQDAEDATGETFIKAWCAMPPKDPNTFKAWIYTIAINMCNDKIKRRKLHPAVSVAQGQEPAGGTSNGNYEDADCVSQALDGLDGYDKQILRLKYACEWTAGDIAILFGKTAAQVGQDLHSARQKFQTALADECPDSVVRKCVQVVKAHCTTVEEQIASNTIQKETLTQAHTDVGVVLKYQGHKIWPQIARDLPEGTLKALSGQLVAFTGTCHRTLKTPAETLRKKINTLVNAI